MLNIPKAQLISKELGKALTEQQKTLYKEGAAFVDEVSLLNKQGQAVKIESIRDTKHKLIQKFVYKDDTVCQRDYSYGQSKRHNGKGKIPYRDVSVSVKDINGNLLGKSHEIFNTGIPSKSPFVKFFKYLFNVRSQKSVITKSRLHQSDFNNGVARQEICGISQFQNKAVPKFYECKMVKDSSGNVLSKSAKSNVLLKVFLYNEYLPFLLHNISDFRKDVFRHLVKKNNLEDRGLQLKIEYKGNTLRGSYEDKKRLIKSSSNLFCKSDSLNNIAHEVEHARQHKEIDLLHQGLLDGERMKKAKVYSYEFCNYKDGKTDFNAYKAQKIEVEARIKGKKEETIFDLAKFSVIKAFSQDGGTLILKHVAPKVFKFPFAL